MRTNISVFDVVSYVLTELKNIHGVEVVTTWKLQKLVYYCQVWHIVWKESPLFKETIEAWIHGPVCRELYDEHKGVFSISAEKFTKGDSSKLSEEQKVVVHKVIKFYGKKTSTWLRNLTHLEKPWQEAREGMSLSERGNSEITHASIMEYYANLPIKKKV